MNGAASRVLVIKHGAFGDFILATGPFKAIRAHHPGAHIVLLTTAPYAGLARASGWFDEVWVDDRPGPGRPLALLRLARRLRGGGFRRVYDLQTSDRSSLYFRLLPHPKPDWSGIARCASHPHANPRRDFMHTQERQREQLQMAGIAEVPGPDVSWLHGERTPVVPRPFALLVPGGSAHRPGKRWPAAHYVALAQRLKARGLSPVLLGAGAEAPLLAEIAAASDALNLCNQTGFGEIADLARAARVAVGNDTGPMHLIAAAGCRAVVLFSHESDPALCAPRGGSVTVLRRDPLAALAVDEVWAAVGV
jgi:ADP-heptose:LPS heptosyltransferase